MIFISIIFMKQAIGASRILTKIKEPIWLNLDTDYIDFKR